MTNAVWSRLSVRVAAAAALFSPTLAWADEGAAHHDPIAQVALGFAVVLIAAKLGGHFAVLAKQPSVLGELMVGVLLGNLKHFGIGYFDELQHDTAIDLAARLGVLVLLFEVGLESTVGQMLKVGWSSLAVAVTGVAVPFALGWGVGAWLLPTQPAVVHAFLGATLCATSVGITARVLSDLKRSTSTEARIILGAAVIDDVLGLVILAVVTGVIVAADQGAALSVSALALTGVKAFGFLIGSMLLGMWVSKHLFHLASKLLSTGVLLAVGLAFCFLFAWAADVAGLAPIVGAFAAGLILESTHYRDFESRGEHGLEELVKPIGQFLVPIFFVQMGLKTDLTAFAAPGVLALSVALIVAAIIGKQACSLAVLTRGADRLTVGLGMIPRGEVGLIFASIGVNLTIQGQRVVSEQVFSALVVMVIVTTLVTPPALSWRLKRLGPAGPQATST